ncbi:adenylate/guanylate cyclase domain-containing protein [Aestuariivita boseongensis]|uniref:adenylate/guanylate cyclase domain-containing protein n=1 Tax=Aestuariivita boseongensis TaxID=1470562 RepID=UPI000B231DAC|nr:adenylate/guanylate cyclase domain-containing protein [Aestuariivita boseongensis]
MEKRLAAVLAADVVGYSALMDHNRDQTLNALKTFRELTLMPALARYGGRLIKSMGDGWIVEFRSATNAAECAISIQSVEKRADIQLRIGVHTGEVITDGDDIFGDGINIAARLEALAEPGQILLSDTAHNSLDRTSAALFFGGGDTQLKNIARRVGVWRWPDGSALKQAASTVDKPGIAVLPFDNMSGDPEQEYFCDGVSEDIIIELSRFQDLFVIARNSSFSFKGRSVTHRDVARELGVRYMLEGSVRRVSKRIRITAQLIECGTGTHIWAERYDRNLEDIFELQDEITRSVVGAIAPQISQAELARASRVQDIDFNSYDLALKAQALFQEGAYSDESGYENVLALAQQAIDLDARNSQAIWIKAYAYANRYLYQLDDNPDEMLDLAEAAAERLFQSDRSDPRALTVRGIIRHFRRAYDEATSDFLRAFELNPNFALNILLMAWHESLVGRLDEAKEHAQLALRLSPRDADVWVGNAYLALAQAYFAESNFVDARHWGERAIQMTPRAPIRRALMIAASAHLGRPNEARPHAEALATFAPTFLESISSGRLALYRLPEHNSLLVEGIAKSMV